MARRRGPDEEVILQLWQRLNHRTSPGSNAPYSAGLALLYTPLEIRGRTFDSGAWLAATGQYAHLRESWVTEFSNAQLQAAADAQLRNRTSRFAGQMSTDWMLVGSN